MNKGKNAKGKENTQEKTGFELLEYEFKESLFSVVYLLVKEKDKSLFYPVIEAVIELLQILSFPFHHFNWRVGNSMDVPNLILNLLQVDYYLSLANYVIYIVFVYAIILILALVIVDIIYVSYMLSKKKPFMTWPVKTLRTLCSLIVSVLYLPFMELFLLMLDCNRNASNKLVLKLFSEVTCWEGLHVLYSVSAILAALIFFFLCSILCMTYYESSPYKDNPLSKSSSNADIFQLYNKTLALLIFTFFSSEYYQWLRMADLIFWSIFIVYFFIIKKPYYNYIMTLCWNLVACIFVWTNLLLALNLLLDFSSFSGGLIICVLSYPLIIIIIVMMRNPLERKFETPVADLLSGSDCYDHVRYFISLASTYNISGSGNENAICLEGYLRRNQDEEKQMLIRSTIKNKTDENETEEVRKKKPRLTKHDREKKLLEQAYKIFSSCVERFPQTTFLRIQYAIFLLEKMENRNWALRQLMKAEKKRPPLDEQFLIYKYKKIIEEEMMEGGDGESGANIDVISAIAYQNHKQYWEAFLEKAAQEHIQFWTYLAEDTEDLEHLALIGSSINATLDNIEEHWEKMKRYKKNSAKVLKLYASFLKNVLNDREGSKEVLKTRLGNKAYQDDDMDMDATGELQELTKFTEGGYAVMAVSGDSNPGKINMISMGVCSMFGYTKSELIGNDLDILIPKLFQLRHKELILRALDKMEQQNYKEKQVFGKHKSGYIFTMEKQIKALPSIVNNWQFVVVLRKDKKKPDLQSGIILLTKDMIIVDLSFRIVDLMKLAIESISHMKIHIKEMFPEIVNEKYLQENLLMEFKETTFYRPTNINLKEIANIDGNIYTKKERCLVKLRTNRREPEKRLCMAKEIIFADGYFAGYALNVRYSDLNYFPAIENEGTNCVTRKFMDNKSKIQWMFHIQRGMFARIDSDFIKPITDWDKQSKMSNLSVHSIRSTSKSLARASHSNMKKESSKDLAKKNEESDEDEEEYGQGSNFFAKMSQKLGIEWNKKDFSKGVVTKRLMNGEFVKISKKAIMKSQEESLLSVNRIDNIDKKEQSVDTHNILTTLKSRKDLVDAIKAGKRFPAIGSISLTSFIGLLILIAMASVDYGLFVSRYNNMIDYINVYVKICDLESQIAFAVENTRNLALINSQYLTLYENYSTSTLYKTAVKEKLLNIQQIIDNTQKDMSEMSQMHKSFKDVFIGSKDITISLRVGDTYYSEMYNLHEAIIMFNAFVIKVANGEVVPNATSEVESEYFIRMNGLNSIFIKLRQSLQAFDDSIKKYAEDSQTYLMITFICTVSLICICCGIIGPFLHKVSAAKSEILLLFFQIKRNYCKMFSKRCQQFFNSMQKKQNDEDSEGEGSEQDADDEDNDLSIENFTANNFSPTSKKTVNILGIIMIIIIYSVCLSIYYIFSYLFFGYYLFNSYGYLSSSLLKISTTNSAYILNYLSLRETILNSTWTIETKPALNATLQYLKNLTYNQDIIKDYYSLNENTVKLYYPGFENYIEDYLTETLCSVSKNVFNMTTTECENFAYTIPTKGLHPMMCFATETTKEILVDYNFVNFTQNLTYLNGQNMDDLRVSTKIVLYETIKKIMKQIPDSLNDRDSLLSSIKIGAFIGYILALVFLYITFWSPYLKKLSIDIVRTKSMISIIPFDIIHQVADIQKFVLDKVVFAN